MKLCRKYIVLKWPDCTYKLFVLSCPVLSSCIAPITVKMRFFCLMCFAQLLLTYNVAGFLKSIKGNGPLHWMICFLCNPLLNPPCPLAFMLPPYIHIETYSTVFHVLLRQIQCCNLSIIVAVVLYSIFVYYSIIHNIFYVTEIFIQLPRQHCCYCIRIHNKTDARVPCIYSESSQVPGCHWSKMFGLGWGWAWCCEMTADVLYLTTVC